MKKNAKILVINTGSSSLRFALFSVKNAPGARTARRAQKTNNLILLYKGHFDNHGKPIKDFHAAVANAAQILIRKKLIKDFSEIGAVGHRVVHGGETYSAPTKITPAVLATIRKLCGLAPLHNPANLEGILAAKKLFPSASQIAVFDTAFHQTMPEKAYLYALPYSFYKKFNIRKYGFHGTSHQYVFAQARKKLGRAKTKRTITCHLGNGCSLAAILDGKVVDTSMGFTPMEGVPMGTRSGDIDPGIIFYLIDRGFKAKEINEILNNKSGLIGLSETSSDMRVLWAEYKKGNKKAIRALELFTYRIAKCIGALCAPLGHLDCLVFTGGIGENAWYIRKWIVAYLKHFSKEKVLVIPTDEERQIAEEIEARFY